MDQPPAVAFTAFADVWPRATRNRDRRRPMCHWRWRNFDFDLIVGGGGVSILNRRYGNPYISLLF